MSLDIYHIRKTYDTALERLRTDDRLPKHNRALALKWLGQKEQALTENMSRADKEKNELRYKHTLSKYIHLLTNISSWFPDLSKISEQELAKFKKDFLDDKILGVKGRPIKSKSDYINKIIKSDFFKNFLGLEQTVKKVFNGKFKKEAYTAEYLDEEDVKKIISASAEQHRLTFAVLFGTGLRIGELLQMKKKDFEFKHNADTKVGYYLCHVKAEYSKSQKDRRTMLLKSDWVDMLSNKLKSLKPDEVVFNYTYSAIRAHITELANRLKIKTKPNGERMHIHIFRKSFALHMLQNGFSLDEVKAMLGHQPSSTAIDVYVDYLGLKLKPSVTKIQTDAYLKLKKEVADTQMQMTTMQSHIDDMRLQMKKVLKQVIILRKRK